MVQYAIVCAGRFIALESLRAGDDELQVLISSQKLYFVGRGFDVVLLVPFDELLHCQCISRGKSGFSAVSKFIVCGSLGNR